MLLPWNPYHHPKARALRGIKQPARRHGVGANRVHAARRDQRKIPLDDLGAMVFAAARVRTKCPVRYAANPKLLVSDIQELPPGTWSLESDIR